MLLGIISVVYACRRLLHFYWKFQILLPCKCASQTKNDKICLLYAKRGVLEFKYRFYSFGVVNLGRRRRKQANMSLLPNQERPFICRFTNERLRKQSKSEQNDKIEKSTVKKFVKQTTYLKNSIKMQIYTFLPMEFFL